MEIRQREHFTSVGNQKKYVHYNHPYSKKSFPLSRIYVKILSTNVKQAILEYKIKH